VLGVERIVARSANVAVVLPTIRAYRTGCMLDVEIILRRDALSADDWLDLNMSVRRIGLRGGDRLPDKLPRLGVRYAGGAKATTIGPEPQVTGTAQDPPIGPILTWSPGSSGGGRRDGEEVGFDYFGLWLSPLPPAEPFEFAVEWPFGGIELTVVDLDGAAITSAAGRSAPYWPDSKQGHAL
jgi:hypothetical protein